MCNTKEMLRKMTDSMSNYNENFAEIRYLFRQLIKQMRILESVPTSDRIQPFYYSSEEDEEEQPDDLNLSKNRKRKILENVFGSKRAKHHDSGLEMSFDMAQEPVDEFPVIYTPAKEIEMVVIGKHGTKAPKYVVDGVPSMAFSAATKKIMQEVFPKQILATHTLPGNSVSGLYYNNSEC